MRHTPAQFKQYGITYTLNSLYLYGLMVVHLTDGVLKYKDGPMVCTSQMYNNGLMFFKVVQGLNNEGLHFGHTGIVALYWDQLRNSYMLNDYPAKSTIKIKDLLPL